MRWRMKLYEERHSFPTPMSHFVLWQDFTILVLFTWASEEKVIQSRHRLVNLSVGKIYHNTLI
jgi:hypothetical protein